MNIEDMFNIISEYLGRNGARRIAVFGSYARREPTPDSDIDILVEFGERKSLLDLVRLERELAEELGLGVDLLTEKSISPHLIEKIREEMEVIYG